MSDKELRLIKDIRKHNGWMKKAISLAKERFSSCSDDGKVRIWKDDDIYGCVSTLEHDGRVKMFFSMCVQ